ncbi:MAG: collagen-like protein, partial [Thermoleophilia bacterium]|nr:collagen-like protein [Thermoleophilia bacterium]
MQGFGQDLPTSTDATATVDGKRTRRKHMRTLLRRRPSPAMIVACIALLVALSGTAVATVASVPRNSVGTLNIKNDAVTSAKIRNGQVRTADLGNNAVNSTKVRDNSLTTFDIRNGSLLSVDFAPNQLPAGPPGAKGDKGDPGPAGPAGSF